MLYFLFHMKVRVDIISEDGDMRIDTITNPKQQRQALQKMADDYVALNASAYQEWEGKLREAMNKIVC